MNTRENPGLGPVFSTLPGCAAARKLSPVTDSANQRSETDALLAACVHSVSQPWVSRRSQVYDAIIACHASQKLADIMVASPGKPV
jgi:hypothetical protein